MKNVLFLLTIITMFMGCSKDEDVDNDNFEIQGSAWSRDSSVFKNEIISFGINDIGHYSYTTTTSNPQFHDYELKYVYKKPKIDIKYKDGSHFGSGYIDGNKLNLEVKGTFTRYR